MTELKDSSLERGIINGKESKIVEPREISFEDFIKKIKGPYKNEYKEWFSRLFGDNDIVVYKEMKFIDKSTAVPWEKLKEKFPEVGDPTPVIDKKFNIIFYAECSHTLLVSVLYGYHNNISEKQMFDLDNDILRERYLEEGLGYFLSSASFFKKWQMGKSYIMDEYDKKLLDGESVSRQQGLNEYEKNLAAEDERRPV